MKALLLSGYKRLEFVDLPVPEPREDELLIRVRACGICGSDVHGYDGSTGRRIPPIVMGHEAAGIVEAMGSGVRGFQPGDRVTFDSTIYCGDCFFCGRGEVNLCDRREVLGVSTPLFRRHGAFAEYVTVPARVSCLLPDALPFEHAAMIEAVSVAVHAVSLLLIAKEDTVVVIGAGMIGLNSRECDVVAEVAAATSGRGADLAIECVGTTATVKMAVDCVRKGGAVTLVGNVAPTVELGLQSVVSRQLRLQGSCASSGEYPRCMELMASGAIEVAPLISKVAPLTEGVAWFERLYAGEPGLLKVVLQP
jgi:L-iditol 2-dehydrogenase